jgi:hypothetical protein
MLPRLIEAAPHICTPQCHLNRGRAAPALTFQSLLKSDIPASATPRLKMQIQMATHGGLRQCDVTRQLLLVDQLAASLRGLRAGLRRGPATFPVSCRAAQSRCRRTQAQFRVRGHSVR